MAPFAKLKERVAAMTSSSSSTKASPSASTSAATPYNRHPLPATGGSNILNRPIQRDRAALLRGSSAMNNIDSNTKTSSKSISNSTRNTADFTAAQTAEDYERAATHKNKNNIIEASSSFAPKTKTDFVSGTEGPASATRHSPLPLTRCERGGERETTTTSASRTLSEFHGGVTRGVDPWKDRNDDEQKEEEEEEEAAASPRGRKQPFSRRTAITGDGGVSVDSHQQQEQLTGSLSTSPGPSLSRHTSNEFATRSSSVVSGEESERLLATKRRGLRKESGAFGNSTESAPGAFGEDPSSWLGYNSNHSSGTSTAPGSRQQHQQYSKPFYAGLCRRMSNESGVSTNSSLDKYSNHNNISSNHSSTRYDADSNRSLNCSLTGLPEEKPPAEGSPSPRPPLSTCITDIPHTSVSRRGLAGKRRVSSMNMNNNDNTSSNDNMNYDGDDDDHGEQREGLQLRGKYSLSPVSPTKASAVYDPSKRGSMSFDMLFKEVSIRKSNFMGDSLDQSFAIHEQEDYGEQYTPSERMDRSVPLGIGAGHTSFAGHSSSLSLAYGTSRRGSGHVSSSSLPLPKSQNLHRSSLSRGTDGRPGLKGRHGESTRGIDSLSPVAVSRRRSSTAGLSQRGMLHPGQDGRPDLSQLNLQRKSSVQHDDWGSATTGTATGAAVTGKKCTAEDTGYVPTERDLAALYSRHVEILESKDMEIAVKLSHRGQQAEEPVDEEEMLRLAMEMSRAEMGLQYTGEDNEENNNFHRHGRANREDNDEDELQRHIQMGQRESNLAPPPTAIPNGEEEDEQLQRALRLSEQEALPPPLTANDEEEELQRALDMSQQEYSNHEQDDNGGFDEEEELRKVLALSEQEERLNKAKSKEMPDKFVEAELLKALEMSRKEAAEKELERRRREQVLQLSEQETGASLLSTRKNFKNR